MEELLEGVDMAELQKEVMSNPNIRETVQEVLKNPEALNEFKNFFTGGSKWRNKHTRTRKKRGSSGTHSSTKKHQKDYAKRVDKSFKNFPFAMSSTTSEHDEYEHAYPLKPMSIHGEKKRRGAVDWDSVFEDKMVNRPPNRKVYDEGTSRLSPDEKIHRLRKEAQDIKKALQKKEEKDIKEGKKVMYGGKWSLKYKRSINCRNPKGFSQKQYCKKKNRKSKKKRKKSRKKRKRRKKKRTRRKRR